MSHDHHRVMRSGTASSEDPVAPPPLRQPRSPDQERHANQTLLLQQAQQDAYRDAYTQRKRELEQSLLDGLDQLRILILQHQDARNELESSAARQDLLAAHVKRLCNDDAEHQVTVPQHAYQLHLTVDADTYALVQAYAPDWPNLNDTPPGDGGDEPMVLRAHWESMPDA